MSYKNIMANRQLRDADSAAHVKVPAKPGLLSVHQSSDPYSNLNDSINVDDHDLAFIDAVAAEMEALGDVYLYDEEDSSPRALPVPFTASDRSPCLEIGGLAYPSDCPLADEDDEDYEPDAEIDPDLENLACHTDDEEEMSLEGDEDDDLAISNDGLSEDFVLLDDSLLPEGAGQHMGILLDDSEENFLDFDDEDLLLDIEIGGRSDLGEIQISEGLTREERARQVATRVGGIFGWGRYGIDLLAEIFEEHGWGQARVAVEQLLTEGVSEDGLLLVKELKELWEGNDEYALAFLHRYNRTGYCTYQGGRVLSWRMAARVTQLFPNADICEVESFLNAAFDTWYEGTKMKYRFPVFLNFLKHVITWLDPERCFPGGAFYDELSAADFEYEIERDLSRTHLYRELADYGLLPRTGSDFLSSVGKAREKRA